MTAQSVSVATTPAVASVSASKKVDRAAAGFGVAAGLTMIFNSALVALTDTWPQVDAYAAQWSGHAWSTHGIADLVFFLLVGIFLTRRKFTIGGHSLALFLLLCVAIAVGGFCWWVARGA